MVAVSSNQIIVIIMISFTSILISFMNICNVKVTSLEAKLLTEEIYIIGIQILKYEKDICISITKL